MSTRASSPLVWARASLLVGVALAAGTLAHLSADGALPGPLALLALLAAGTTVAAPLLRRPASTARLVLLLVAGQALVHAALTVLGGHHDDGVEHGPALAHLVADASGEHALMALAHAGAAAVVGLWLAAGERALWTVLGLLLAPLLRPGLPGVPAWSPPARAARSVAAARTRDRLAGCVTRRGPPYPCC